MKQPNVSSLVPEEIVQLRKTQERRFILTLALGTIMAVLGYFTGQKLAGSDANGTDTVHTGATITAVMDERTPIAADFERME